MSGGFSFLTRGAQYGILVNQLQGFERWLNQTYLAKEKLKLKIIYIPVRQDKLLDYLAEGRGDPGGRQPDGHPTRREQVTFSQPLITPIEVGGEPAGLPCLQSHHPAVRPADLGACQLPVISRACTSSISAVSGAGVAPVYIETVPEYLQDGDLLEMVSAGIIPLTVTDSFKGADLARHDWRPQGPQADSAGTRGAAPGPRNNSPELLKAVNASSRVEQADLYSDMTLRRLLAQSDRMSNILAPDPLGATVDHSARYWRPRRTSISWTG